MMEQAQELLREVVQRGRTPKFAAVLRKMESESASLIVHETGGRIRSIWDLKLGGVELTRPGEGEEADREVRRFLAQHAELFEVDSRPERGLELKEVRGETSQRLSYSQRHQGLRVVDGDFAAFFSEEGAFRGLSGAPWPENRFPSDITARISESEALAIAIEHLRETFNSARLAKDLEGEAELVVSGARQSVLWLVLVTHKLSLGVERELLVDAISGEVVNDHNLIAAGARKVWVRCLRHKGGQKDDSNSGTPSTQLHDIHVDPEPVGKGSACAVRLQRLGPFRARMWNARLSGGTDSAPLFGATMTIAPCNDLSQLDLFKQEPQSSTVDDSTFRFNEQNVYVWAQKFKTQLDEWGRTPGPGGEYGYKYKVKTGRDVNLEIVVNGDSAREGDWFNVNVNVMHGYFRKKPSSSWFPGVSEPHAVFFFNSIGNQHSPQFVGKEFSASYSIIAHEVGHFISWTYGYWPGSSTNMSTSLNEGMSMALPAVWGKARWGGSLTYTDSAEVTTGSKGSKVGGSQWKHHLAGDPERYDLLDCEAERPSKLAWPWVQAIWELANNINRENNDSIWTSDKVAVNNTADFLMDLLHTQAGVSDRNWNDIAIRMMFHQLVRHKDGLEQGARPHMASFLRVNDILDHHGLFDSCT